MKIATAVDGQCKEWSNKNKWQTARIKDADGRDLVEAAKRLLQSVQSKKKMKKETFFCLFVIKSPSVAATTAVWDNIRKKCTVLKIKIIRLQ